MTDNTSSGVPSGATPAPDSPPAMGNAPGGAMPQKPAVTLEEALAQYAELQKKYDNAEGELKRHRDFRTKYEKQQAEAEAAKKAAEEAQLSEIERVKKQHAQEQSEKNALIMELQEIKITNAVERYARELHFVYPEDVIHSPAFPRAELEFDDNGNPTNVKHLLEKLAKARPKLVEQPAPAPDPSQPGSSTAPTTPARPGTPALPAFNPGRTQITPPGTLPPGQHVTLAEFRNRRK